jgi:hypothetical protein
MNGLLNPIVLAAIQIGLNLMLAVSFARRGDGWTVGYWVAAAALNACVTGRALWPK